MPLPEKSGFPFSREPSYSERLMISHCSSTNASRSVCVCEPFKRKSHSKILLLACTIIILSYDVIIC